MTIMANESIRRLKSRFVPSATQLAWIALGMITSGTGMTWGQEAPAADSAKPSLFSTAKILGGLSDQTELFSKLDVSSPYQESGSYLTVPDRSELSGDFPAGDRFPVSYTWMTPGTFHHPLYFEQVNLERYGTGLHPLLQPAYSAAHFFSTIPILPYKMGDQCPTSIQYSLGNFRPGDCTPHYLHRRAFSWKGAGVQAAAVSGLLLAAP